MFCKFQRFALIALLALSSTLFADQVTLKNGDRLTGMIVKSDAKTLLIKTEFAGEVTLQWEAVTGMVTELSSLTKASGATSESGGPQCST